MAVFLAISTTVAFADTISDKKKELDNVNKNIENAKSEISKVKSEQDDLVSQIAKIELDLKEKEEQLAEIEESLSAIQESIQLTEKELKEAIEKAELHKELMDERLCAMYMTTGTSNAELIEIMLDSKNITDFLDRVAMIREIMSLDREIFDEMQSIKEEIEDKKEFLEEQREIEEGTKKDVAAQKVAIEQKHKEKEQLFQQLKEQQKKMEEDLGKLEKTSKDLQSAIQRLVAEQREREEQARRAQAQRVSQQVSGQQTNQGGSGSNNRTSTQSENPAPNRGSGSSSEIVNFALKFQGTPYVYGANGPNAFDCSGFTSYVYRNFGINLPRTAAGQASASMGTRINNKADLRPGDLVFFSNGGGGIHHAGIYIGGGTFVHASSGKRTRKVVTTSLTSGYHSKAFRWGRRIIR